MKEVVQVEENGQKSLSNKAENIATEANALVVKSVSQHEVAKALVKSLTELEKEIKSFFKESKDKAKDLHSKIVSMEKQQLEPVVSAKAVVKSKINDFVIFQDRLDSYVADLQGVIQTARNIDPEEVRKFVFLRQATLSALEDVMLLDGKVPETPEELRYCEEELMNFRTIIKQAALKISTGRQREAQEVSEQLRESGRKELATSVEENVEKVEVVEVKKTQTVKNKLVAVYEYQDFDLFKIAKAVADGKLPAEVLSVKNSAMSSYMKMLEKDDRDLEAFMGKIGVHVKVSRKVR